MPQANKSVSGRPWRVASAVQWAIVPVKHTAVSKGRLAPALGPDRKAFARELALHTIEVIRTSVVFNNVLIITSDPWVRAACTEMEVRVLNDHGVSLNDACALGLETAASLGADVASIIHADLAMLDAQTLTHIVGQFEEVRVNDRPDAIGLVRCKDGSGTNMVLVDPNTPFTPRFGQDSFAEHVRQAGSRARELVGGKAVFDVDTPDDLKHLLRTSQPAGWLEPYALLLESHPFIC